MSREIKTHVTLGTGSTRTDRTSGSPWEREGERPEICIVGAGRGRVEGEREINYLRVACLAGGPGWMLLRTCLSDERSDSFLPSELILISWSTKVFWTHWLLGDGFY